MEEGRKSRMNPAEVFQATNSTSDSSFFEKYSKSSILEAEKNTVPTRKYGMKPEVFRAASTGNSSFFEGDSNSNLHEVTPEENTVLHVALKFKQVKAAEKILNLSPSLVLRTNTKGNTPLHVAALVGASSLVKILIKKAKDERDVEASGQQPLRTVNQDGDTALHVAVRYDNDNEFEIVKELIKEDQELAKYVNNAGESALFLAVDRQHYDMALHILSNAPDCSYAGRHGMNVLHALVIHTSSYSNKGDFLPKFLKFWEQDGPERGRALIAVVWIFHVLFLKPLPEYLTRRQDVSDRIDRLRFLYISFLAKESFPKDFVNIVVEKWPSAIEEGDDSGWTPLHIAAHLGNKKFVELLLEKDNSPAYVRNNEGLSALHIAAKEDNYHVMKELMEACPDMYELLDNKGRNALHAASENDRSAAFHFFYGRPEFEGLINQQDKDGNTPTNLAAINGHIYVSYEFRKGRRVALNATNKEGFTTMDNILLREKLGSRPTTEVWSEGARPSLRGVLLKMGIRQLDPRKKSEMGIRKLDPREKSEMAGDGNVKDNGKGMSQSDLLVKEVSETNLLVATLIATVTFTAAFTVPGGFNQNGNVGEGLAVFRNKLAFRVFLIANTLAVGLSTTSLLVQFMASRITNEDYFHLQMVRHAPVITSWSIGALLVTFIAGTYTVVPQSFGITAAVILSCCFLYCMFLPYSIIRKGKEKA